MERKRTVVNIILIIAVAGAWLMMTFGGEGTLSENGFGNLKYFTVLSNILEAVASAVWLASRNGDEVKKERAERLKYISAAAVMLTFTTVMVFLGPLYGYSSMFVGANLFLHLLIPLASFAEIVFLSDTEYSRRDNRLVIIPPLIYGAVYLSNIMINGIGEWPDTNDFYLFLAWGYPVGILIFAVICLVTWLLGLLMRKLRRTMHKTK